MSIVNDITKLPGMFFQALYNIVVGYRSTVGEPLSMTEITKVTRVEPIVVVGKDVSSLEYAPEIMHTVLNIFLGYYLQAASLLSAEIEDVRIVKILDRLNPDRDLMTTISSHSPVAESIELATLSGKAYKYGLPNYNLSKGPVLAFESATTNDSSNKILSEQANLAVGKMVNVTLKSGGEKGASFVMPVNVRLNTVVVDDKAISALITNNTDDLSFSSRWDSWLAGKIEFVRDLVMCDDIIKKQKALLKSDTYAIYQEIVKRANNSRMFGLAGAGLSMSGVSSIYVISDEVEREIQKSIGGKLSNPRTRDIVFQNSLAMLIVVVDRDYERVTIYAKGVSSYTQVTVKEIKMANKSSKGPDIGDVLKAFATGHAPSL